MMLDLPFRSAKQLAADIRKYGDLTCLGFAGLLEREFQAFVPPPGYA